MSNDENEKTQELPVIDPFENLHPLVRFCAHPISGDLFGGPWAQDGFVYSTDRQILVRVPKSDGHAHVIKNGNNALLNAQLDEQWGKPRRSVKNPAAQLFDTTNPNCRRCAGDGAAACSFGHMHSCDKCNGDFLNPTRLFKWGPNAFSAYYIREINRHWCELFAPIALGDPMRFEIYDRPKTPAQGATRKQTGVGLLQPTPMPTTVKAILVPGVKPAAFPIQRMQIIEMD